MITNSCVCIVVHIFYILCIYLLRIALRGWVKQIHFHMFIVLVWSANILTCFLSPKNCTVFGFSKATLTRKSSNPLDKGPERDVDILHLLLVIFVKHLWLLGCKMVFPVTDFTWKRKNVKDTWKSALHYLFLRYAGCTFSHEGRDGMIKNRCWNAGVVGHRVFLHALKRRELHNFTDDLIRDGQVEIIHDTLHFTPRILGEKNTMAVYTTSLLVLENGLRLLLTSFMSS